VFTLGIPIFSKPVTSIYKSDSEDITDILLKVALTPYSILSVALAWNGTTFSLREITQKQKYQKRMKSEVPFFSLRHSIMLNILLFQL
jgi:hypothetical protein